MAPAPLYGLVLSGGRSMRMGADKGALIVAGQTQIERAMGLLSPLCERVFLSCRPAQADWPAYAPHPQIHDRDADIGPMGGILSAMGSMPDAAWLVLACDMPRLTPEVLSMLVNSRSCDWPATALTDASLLPEPLCAIYEPAFQRRLRRRAAAGQASPKRALLEGGFFAVPCPDPKALQSANSPNDLAAIEEAPGR